MKIPWRILVLGLFLFFSVAGFYSGFISLPVAEGTNGVAHDLSGYAWSSNIGWISFNGFNDGVSLSAVNEFEKYAWSSNIGWIRFNPIIGSGGNALPSGQSGAAAQLNPATGQVTGWIRACSVFKSGCQGNNDPADNYGLKLDSDRGGWDGWISMEGTAVDGSPYGVTYDTNSGQLRDYAWGADVVGWIDFCPKDSDPTLGDAACVTLDTLNVQCQTTDANGNQKTNFDLDPITGTVDVTWETTNPTDSSYTYNWSWNDGQPTASGRTVTKTYSTADNNKEGTVTVTNGGNGTATCRITVSNPNTPQLSVTVSGGTYGKVTADNSGSNPLPSDWISNGCRDICSNTYSVTDTVTLTGTPDPLGSGACLDPDTGDEVACVFDGWIVNGSDVVCPGTSPCGLDMSTGDKFVTAKFRNPAVDLVEVTIDSTPAILKIDSHNSGQPAYTPPATISVTRIDGGDNSVLEERNAKVCIDSFISSSGGMSIYNIVNDDTQRTFCDFDDDPGYCGQRSQCSTLSSSNNYSTHFQIMIPDRSIALRDGSPYFITLSILGDGLSGQRELRFIYNIGGGGP
ncbi:MAG: PKD domain-containing protein [Candidatus Vogelbacteria bacterium]|nr:PKD domain-containing protein [Candidatus Vogelbacteria bacterium]